MEFSEYQRKSKKTAIYPRKYKVFYPALGLSGEVGELNNKIKKNMRDKTPLNKDDLAGEIGDILWYIAAVTSDLNLSLDKIAQGNLEKLASRKKRGTISGSGDNR